MGSSAADKKWKLANPEKVSASNRKGSVVRRLRETVVHVEPVDYQEVYRRYRGCCGICDFPVPFACAHWDHIIPIVHQGPHVNANLQPAHSTCNHVKGGRTLGWARDRIKLRIARGLYQPATDSTPLKKETSMMEVKCPPIKST